MGLELTEINGFPKKFVLYHFMLLVGVVTSTVHAHADGGGNDEVYVKNNKMLLLKFTGIEDSSTSDVLS